MAHNQRFEARFYPAIPFFCALSLPSNETEAASVG
jgi:hypothetical protein